MMTAMHIVGVHHESISNDQVDVYLESESQAGEINTEYLPFHAQTDLNHQDILSTGNWHVIVSSVIRCWQAVELSTEPWPIQSKINSYFSLVSFQYFKSAMGYFSATN